MQSARCKTALMAFAGGTSATAVCLGLATVPHLDGVMFLLLPGILFAALIFPTGIHSDSPWLFVALAGIVNIVIYGTLTTLLYRVFGQHRRGTRASLLALTVATLSTILLPGCSSTSPTPKPTTQTPSYTYPAHPTVPPPAFKVFHQDNDTYTLTTKPDATDPEIAAILWQFRDAAHARTFAALHLDQKFIDARKPSIWFHIYRGPKCAAEKFTKGKYPCGAKYNGAGDYTLGAYNNPQWDDAVLHNPDGTETHLWNSEAPYKP